MEAKAISQIKAYNDDWKDSQDKLDEKYPDRHTTIHKVPCKNCPSHQNAIHGIIDEESQDYKTHMTKEEIAKHRLFVCYCRQSKLCKGLCDFMEIDQDYLNRINQPKTK